MIDDHTNSRRLRWVRLVRHVKLTPDDTFDVNRHRSNIVPMSAVDADWAIYTPGIKHLALLKTGYTTLKKYDVCLPK